MLERNADLHWSRDDLFEVRSVGWSEMRTLRAACVYCCKSCRALRRSVARIRFVVEATATPLAARRNTSRIGSETRAGQCKHQDHSSAVACRTAQDARLQSGVDHGPVAVEITAIAGGRSEPGASLGFGKIPGRSRR